MGRHTNSKWYFKFIRYNTQNVKDCHLFYLLVPLYNSTDIDTVIVDSSFPEPRLVLFEGDTGSTITQGFIVAEKNVIFEITNFSVFEGLVLLLATYYTSK